MARTSQEIRDWRKEHGRFVARETGTDYVPPIADYDPKTQVLPEKVAQSLGDLGRMPHPVAMEEARAHAEEIAARPDIDPDDDLRGAMLQRLVRSGLFPATGETAEPDPSRNMTDMTTPPTTTRPTTVAVRLTEHPLVKLALVTLLTKDPRKRVARDGWVADAVRCVVA